MAHGDPKDTNRYYLCVIRSFTFDNISLNCITESPLIFMYVCRHMGDLGNIVEDQFGNIGTTLKNDKVFLYGERSVMGRSIVVNLVSM